MDREKVLEQLIAETDRPLALAEAELRTAQEKVEHIKAERYGLELALARHRGDPAPPPLSPAREEAEAASGASEWQAFSRTEAAERVLQLAGRPMHRKAIREELHRHGRGDSLEHLSAALAYLKRRKRIAGKGQGMWVHPEHDWPLETTKGLPRENEEAPANDGGPEPTAEEVIRDGPSLAE